MSELAKSYEPAQVEPKWAKLWEDNKSFAVDNPLEADFAISLPPPNVTGELHMGHALNDTLQDVLIRYYRMMGKKVHWQIGCDHAGIGTQIVVEKQIAKEGKTKYDLGREAFEKRIWDWTNDHLGKIEGQMKLLGCSPDWSKSEFTLNPNYVRAVRKTFFELFREGLIYQGTRLINWCPHCLTSLSDLEVVHEDKTGKLYKIKYPLVQSFGELTELVVATSRPETLFGDVAVAINPSDERYKALSEQIKNGKSVKVSLPLTGKEIPVILSDAVQTDFGTGALKITPAHDFNDQEITKTWNQSPLSASTGQLDPINIFTERAQLLPLEFIPAELHGLEGFKAREKTLELLSEKILLVEEEKYSQAAALHDRCGTVIEPYLSKQWFVKMNSPSQTSLDNLAINALEQGKVRFYPERYGKTYLDWLNNIQDWCISRQLWWGHQIPVWTKKIDLLALNDSRKAEEMHEQIVNQFKVVSKDAGFVSKPNLRSDAHHPSFITGSKAGNEYIFQYTEDSAQVVLLEPDDVFESKLKEAGYLADPDVLDTWFSSALWPMAAQGWPEKSIQKSEWTNVLITAREIINLWVVRMIFSSLKFTEKLPFTDILIHPVIQTPDGKRMSKSKGNAIDPIALVNKYGADASRLWYCSVGIFASQDTRFPGRKEKDGTWTSPEIENKRRFINKLWNATKFVMQNLESETEAKKYGETRKSILEVLSVLADENSLAKNTANIWILSLWNKTLEEAHEHLQNYRFAEYSQTLENFVWDEFCDWYLELAKLNLADENKKSQTAQTMFYILEQIVRALAPIIPFVSEELWQALTNETGSLTKKDYPVGLDVTDKRVKEQIDNANIEIETGKQIVQVIRSIRQKTFGLPPTQTLNIFFSDSSGEAPDGSVAGVDHSARLSSKEAWIKIARATEDRKLNPTLTRVNTSLGFKTVSKTLSVQKGLSGKLNRIVKITIEVPETVDLAGRKNVLETDLKKKQTEKTGLEGRYNNQGFMKNASEEVKAELKANLERVNREIEELQEALNQIAEAARSV